MSIGKGKKWRRRMMMRTRGRREYLSWKRAREKDSFIFVVCSFIVLGLLA